MISKGELKLSDTILSIVEKKPRSGEPQRPVSSDSDYTPLDLPYNTLMYTVL